MQGIYSSPVAQICINFLTFWILLSYLVPISLFVTMEIVKFWQVSQVAWAVAAGLMEERHAANSQCAASCCGQQIASACGLRAVWACI